MEKPVSETCNTENQGLNTHQDVLMDFSTMFKGKRNAKKPIQTRKNVSQQTKTVNWLLEIPAKLPITKQDLQERKVMDQKRWHSITKANTQMFNTSTQQFNLKMISAVVSCWNYLYSEKGLGNKKFLNTKTALNMILEHDPQILQKQIDEFQRKKYIEEICQIISGSTGHKILMKPALKLSEPEKIEEQPENQLKQMTNGLSNKQSQSTYIYLTYQEVLCPIGYQITPLKPLDAYVKLEKIDEKQLWIICSSIGSFQQTFQIKRWKHIKEDLQAQYPQYLDIKQAKKGVQKRDPEHTNPDHSGNPNEILEITISQ